MEIMFSTIFTKGEHSWDSYTLEVNENGGREGEGEDGVVEEEENIEVIRTVRTEDNGYDDCGILNIRLENIEVDNDDSIGQEGNKKKKAYSSKDGKEKPIKRIKSKVGTAAGARLFIKRQYRETLIALEDNSVRVAWLEDGLELIKQAKRTSRH
ncbi:hypothetical protein Cgig2_007460 [Carnegiea gigantea]|uniref:Uncharacterized protein n=1 Tax=Carnegiea gigantea TaxID=171969 RepID=A0A9Q1JII0_9CARY|nr:hypothetical protein Cgig2_007460 [Carnegiea gigantea]